MRKDRPVSNGQKASLTKGEQTRHRIVAAAAPIFNQHGFEGSSLNDLMEATGLRKGGIYRHFSSKEELAAEAFDYTWHAVWKARMHNVDEKPTGIEKLKQLIANFVSIRSPVAGGCPVLNTAVDTDDGNPILRARAADALKFWLNRLQRIVARAAQDGELKATVDPVNVATFIVASLEGALMISRLQGSDKALRRIEQQLYRYLDADVAISR